jgi:hypothetical protein
LGVGSDQPLKPVGAATPVTELTATPVVLPKSGVVAQPAIVASTLAMTNKPGVLDILVRGMATCLIRAYFFLFGQRLRT